MFRALAINRRGKNEDPELTVRTEKMRLVRYLLYLYCVSDEFGNGFKFLKQVESKRGLFEIGFKSLARFSAQVRVKESFKPLLAK